MTDVIKTSERSAYAEFLRDCAFDARNFERKPLTGGELSMLIGEDPTMLDEACADMPTVLVRLLLEQRDIMGIGSLLVVCLREKAMSWIASDLKRARLDHEEDTRIDQRFHA